VSVEETVRVGVVQAAPVFLDREGSTQRAVDFIREAGRRGVELLAFPEGFIPAHPVWYHFHPATGAASLEMAAELFENAVEVPGTTTRALATAARDAGTAVVIGICERRPATTGTLYNTQLFIERDGHLVGKHQKLTPTVGERLVHTGGYGDTLRTYDMQSARVSGLICGENSNPLAVAALGFVGAQIHVASWPNNFSRNEQQMVDMVTLASRSLAYKTGCFVLNACATISDEMVARIAYTDEDRAFLADRRNGGGSSIVGADTSLIAGPMDGNEEGMLVADINLRDCVRAKTVHDYSGHYNRADVFTLVIDRHAPSLFEEVVDSSVARLPDELSGDDSGSQASRLSSQ
jgi:nitrilase